MKIVICSLNSQYIHSSLAPYCLLAGMKQYGNPSWHTAVIEGTVNEPLDAVCEKIVSAGPDVVGFCCYIWNIKRVYELITMVKARLNSVKIIVGGPEVGYCPSHVLEKSSDIDFVITGEGEKALPLLVSCIETEETPHIAGVSYRGEDGVISHPEEALEEPPSPYSEEYFNQLNGRIAYLETSRGCPYSCAYCLSARCGKLKFYSIQRAKEEILMLAKSGAKTVKFVDRTFNAHRDRAKELFAFIIEHIGKEIPKGVCFHFEIAGDLLDDETVALLQTAPAGSIQLEIGIQSFHEETLSYIRRKTDLEKVIRQVGKLLHKNNIHIHVDLIAGLPLENFSLFRESVNKAYGLKAHMLQLGFLKLLHGSPMREQPQRYPCSFSNEAPYEVLETPWITNGELKRLHKVEWALDKLYNSGRFSDSLQYVLQTTDITPFDFFLQFGEWAGSPAGVSLARVAELFMEFCLLQSGVEKDLLRNAMVCDWLSSVCGGKLPLFLQVKDAILGEFRKRLRKDELLAPKPGIPRGAALLYHPTRGVYVDYEFPHPVTGRYELHFVAL